jgi:cephalosporin-C deacetylase-like acetyl esterase
MLGLDPFPEKTDLRPVITGKVEHEEFTVEKLHFQSRPRLYVTANLYIPKNLEAPAPTILYVCGHGGVKKNGISYGNKVTYQHHAAWFARHGYVCMVIDSLQLGEIEATHHGTYRYDMWWWNCRGYSSAAVEAWNCIRSLDYLETREEVDKTRFGVTGRSGGGAYSWWISTIDERIKVAVPVAGIADLQNHVVDGTVEGHCDCMFFVNTYRWDYLQLPALVAPRPLLISNTDKDRIFPLDGVTRTYLKTMQIYDLYNARNNLGLHICEGPHKDTQQLRVHAFTWFNRFLKDDTSLIHKPAEKFFEPEQLKVFDELPADQINTKIHDTFVPKAPPPELPESKRDWRKQRKSWKRALRKKVFRGWPGKAEAGPLDLEEVFSEELNGLELKAYDFTSQPNVRLRLYVFRLKKIEKPAEVQVTVLGKGASLKWFANIIAAFDNKSLTEVSKAFKIGSPENLRDYETPNPTEMSQGMEKKQSALAVVAPRGLGRDAWNDDEKKQIQIRRRFMLLGQTADSMRVWDVRRAIQALRSIDQFEEIPLNLHGNRNMAGIALYAALFEPDIHTLTFWVPPNSHAEGPIFLNVLRYLDFPQAVAMVAEKTKVYMYKEDHRKWQFPTDVARKLNWPEDQFRNLYLDWEQPEKQMITPQEPAPNPKPDVPNVIRVGPNRKYKMPSQAANAAKDGDIVEIDPGVYESDVAVWRQNDLTIRATAKYAHLKSNGAAAQKKAIWVVKGRNATIENIEFSGCRVPDRNGAGIRIEGQNITIRNCYFHDNENGVLGGSGKSNILIEFTEFARNGHGDGYSHNMYIGHAAKLTIRHCYSHHARIGHNLKSRAHENHILYNRIGDEAEGTSSYCIDLPNGGRSFIIGNQIQQGPKTDNSTVVSYGAEGLKNPKPQLYMANNTIVNDRRTGVFVYIRQGTTAKLINNLFVGNGTPVKGKAEQITNLAAQSGAFIDRAKFDYRLKPDSPAIDAGSKLPENLTPLYEYVHPANRRKRTITAKPDIGAFEYRPN